MKRRRRRPTPLVEPPTGDTGDNADLASPSELAVFVVVGTEGWWKTIFETFRPGVGV